jgi:hypothetical protein
VNIEFVTMPSGSDPRVLWEADYTAPWRDEAVITALGERAWDGPVVRLSRHEPRRARKRAAVVLQRARHLDHIGTNLSPIACERTDAIGIVSMLFTADGRCILQRRPADPAIPPGLIGPSTSSPLRPADLDGVMYLSGLDPRRVIREELRLCDDEIGPLHLMALIREPEHAGAPALMYRGTIRLTAAALLARGAAGEPLCVDPMAVRDLPDLTASVNHLLWLLIREDMGR